VDDRRVTEESDPNATEPTAIEEVEFGPRRVRGAGRRLVSVLAGVWSLFQLSLPYSVELPGFGRLNSDIVRTIHLVFAIALVYLCYPAARKRKFTGFRSFLSARTRVPAVDAALALGAAVAAGYYAFDYVGLGQRQGLPLARDIFFGVLLLVLLLEASRRALGPALPCIALCFMGLCFLGPDLPDFIAFKRVSPNQLLGQLTMSTEGIYGIPLYVSASMVFLFVLFGATLEKSGGGRWFVQVAFSLLGRFKGGPAKAAVLASGMTGLVSGSSIANTVTTGTFTIPLMKRCGYPAEKAAAVEVAASTNGQLMPPIMGAAAFIIAERCNLPYIEVVRAAFVPAVVSYLALLFITHLEASKLGLQGLPAAEVPRFRSVFPKGVHFLIPLALLVTLLFRRYSPELSAFWAILALMGLIVVRDLVRAGREGAPFAPALRGSLQLIWESLVAGGRAMMGIGVAVATAGIIVGVMTLGLGSLVTEVIIRLSGGNLALMLGLTACISLLLGMGLPTTANYIVISTLVAPAILLAAGQAGLAVPLIAAHLFCFFFGILADDTPPVGLAAYAAAAIAGSDPIKTGIQGFIYDMRTALLPFMFFFNTELLLINVHSFWHAAGVFVTATVAMFAFAALTQNWLIVRNRPHEAAALALATLVLLRPEWCQRRLGCGDRLAWYAVGCALFAAVCGLQHLRRTRQGRSGQVGPRE